MIKISWTKAVAMINAMSQSPRSWGLNDSIQVCLSVWMLTMKTLRCLKLNR